MIYDITVLESSVTGYRLRVPASQSAKMLALCCAAMWYRCPAPASRSTKFRMLKSNVYGAGFWHLPGVSDCLPRDLRKRWVSGHCLGFYEHFEMLQAMFRHRFSVPALGPCLEFCENVAIIFKANSLRFSDQRFWDTQKQ